MITPLLLVSGAGCLIAGSLLLWGVGVMLLVIGVILLGFAMLDMPGTSDQDDPAVAEFAPVIVRSEESW